MTLTAYHKYLLQVSKDREIIAGLIYKDCLDKNPQAIDLLAETGDTFYTRETFVKAADLILNNE